MSDVKQTTTVTLQITVIRKDGKVEKYPPVEMKHAGRNSQ